MQFPELRSAIACAFWQPISQDFGPGEAKQSFEKGIPKGTLGTRKGKQV